MLASSDSRRVWSAVNHEVAEIKVSTSDSESVCSAGRGGNITGTDDSMMECEMERCVLWHQQFNDSCVTYYYGEQGVELEGRALEACLHLSQ